MILTKSNFNLSKASTMMETESNECMQLAEKKERSYLGNALKRKSEQTKKELTTLQKEIAELEIKNKKMV